jgi:ATP-dependent RNA helicase SUPV3L1/SUV3
MRMPAPFRMDLARVRAILGPTNTGKTHLAIDRLLAHDSGIIGFPLRLLARENYDRLVRARGPTSVALITGEEKIIPAGARWFACTVEAMPLDRPVALVAVDEIQLCADPDRGHIFTDRLLHARGLAETLFLGAETIAPLLRLLVPQVEIETRPRLSQLTHAGAIRLGRLPPRSAIVAFSAPEVYAIAEAVRRRRGGCAVVMGRLSPRTRNAQVKMFQDKEVDYLVATDAIGMGLNMDVNHVAFASLLKFDGHRQRTLDPAEVAQIAGRAGRGMRDGTFGTLAGGAPLPPTTVEQVEDHRFAPLETLMWRSGALDFASPEALLAALARPAPHRTLQRAPEAADHQTLLALVRDPDIRAQAQGGRPLRLLWEACSIPDFRKLGDDSHTRLCARVFGHLVDPPHRLPEDWIDRSLAELARLDGDIDTLMQRLAGVRVWAYLATRGDWVANAVRWQAESRRIEDSLSDALHDRLTARFVDRRAAHLIRRLESGEPDLLAAISAGGEVLVEGHPVGRLDGFRFLPDPLASGEAQRALLRAARRMMGEEVARRVAWLEASPDAAFRLDDANRIMWQPPSAAGDAPWAAVARLRAGPEPARPRIDPVDSEFLDDPRRRRVVARLVAWLQVQIAGALAPLQHAHGASLDDGLLRGLVHQLNEMLGIIPAAVTPPMAREQRAAARRLGIRIGRFATFLPALLKPAPARLRAALRAAALGQAPPRLPPPGAVSLPIPADPALNPADWLACGWLVAGPLLVRLDIAERIAADLAAAARGAVTPVPLPPQLAQHLGCSAALVPAVVRHLGVRVLPGADGTPVYRPRRVRPPPPPDRPRATAVHPAFGALAHVVPPR